MILKKPYAFLIKKFKLIHLVLTLLVLFVIVKTNAINNFFSSYVKNNYSAVITDNFKSNFINAYLYLSIIGIIIILIFILFLLKYKNKKERIYTGYVAYYVVLIIALIFMGNYFDSLEKEVLSPEMANILKDISLIVLLPQFPLIIVTTFRTLGFNVKQFDFSSDIKELEITSSDDEEIEFSVSFDTYKAERNTRRFIREFRYYIRENVFVMILLLIIFTGVGVNYILKNNSKIKSGSFNLNQVVYFNNLETSVLNAVITNTDTGGSIISKDKHYILLKVSINNTTSKDITINPEEYSLYNKTKNISIKPSVGYSNYFKDYGISIGVPYIRRETSYVVVLPYEIASKDIKDKYEFRLYKSMIVKNNISYPVYDILKLKPTILDAVSDVSKVGLKEKITFNNTILNNSFIRINEFVVSDSYTYEYERCIKDECSTYYDKLTPGVFNISEKTLLVMKTDFELDNTTDYAKSFKTLDLFATDFISVIYHVDDIRYISKAETIVSKYDDSLLILKVDKYLKDANRIDLAITIRNKRYIVQLKN